PMAEAELITREAIPAVLTRLVVCATEAEAVASAQFVMEVVAEDLKVKQELFARVEALVEPRTILASNSSSLPMTAIAAQMRRPERAILCHWFNPPPIIPVVEVAPGRQTSDETIQLSMELLRRIRKTPVRINQEVPGLVVNRVQVALRREIFDLLE